MRGGTLSWPRTIKILGASYLTIWFLGNVMLWAGVAAGRALGRDTRIAATDLPPIKHLRMVDEALWVGAQPRPADFIALAANGVTSVIDLRAHVAGDPREDDPEQLASLGIDYHWLPIADGQAPREEVVDRFLTIVERAEGVVFMHCGGGVGRSTSMTAAYEAARGKNPSLLEQLAIGPMSLEQAWFIEAVGAGEPVAANVVLRTVSRYVVDAPRVLLNRIERLF